MEAATKEVMLLGIYFMILFTAFNSFQTIVTKINEDEGDYTLGPFRFALNYTVFMIANLFAPQVKYSEKWLITGAALTYVLQYSTGLLMQGTSAPVKFISAAFGATINGIGASVLWTNAGAYIHKVCHAYNKVERKGYYYGLFNMLFCISTILGAIVVTFGLSFFSHTVYFIIVSGVALLAFFFGSFFIKDIKYDQGQHKQVKHEQVQKKESSCGKVINAAKQTLRFYPIMKFTLCLILIDGINLGVSTSTMLHLAPKVEDKKQNSLNAGFCLLMFGCGCTLGGFLGGRLSDRFRIRLSSIGIMLIYSLCCLFSILASQLMQMWSAMLSCFLWGFTMYYITGLLQVICSSLYQGRPQTFALVKQLHCLSFVIYQIVCLSTDNSIPVPYLMIVLLAMGIPAIWGICRSPEEKKSQVNEVVGQKQEKTSQSTSNIQQSLISQST